MNRIPVSVASKVCPRCGVDIHAPDAPHLCADKVERIKRREKQVEAVMDILYDAYDERRYPKATRLTAERIVKLLMNMGVEHD